MLSAERSRGGGTLTSVTTRETNAAFTNRSTRRTTGDLKHGPLTHSRLPTRAAPVHVRFLHGCQKKRNEEMAPFLPEHPMFWFHFAV